MSGPPDPAHVEAFAAAVDPEPADARRRLPEDSGSDTPRFEAGVPRQAPTHPPPLAELPARYIDMGELGRGGMGTVRQARDVVLGREVAVKRLDPWFAADPAGLQGFGEEARIAAQLEHPNIAPVFDYGFDSVGVPYYTMKQVRGSTLESLLREPSLALGTSERLTTGLEVLLKVCDAVAFAHSRGVIHRDIKPANIMVGAFGEVFLVDWGIAEVLRDRPGAVDVPRPPSSALGGGREGAVGTPAYMPPEVARGENPRLDERTDVFGVGAVLYAIVTGHAPFEGNDLTEVLARAQTGLVTPPNLLPNVFVPEPLVDIVMKALAADPRERYPSVIAFADSVRRLERGGLHLPQKAYSAGETIVAEGDPADCVYIVLRGHCDVYKTVAGQRRLLRTMGPGTLFGEAAVFGAAPRTATVEALTDVILLVITRESLGSSMGAGSWTSLLVQTLIERFHELEQKLG